MDVSQREDRREVFIIYEVWFLFLVFSGVFLLLYHLFGRCGSGGGGALGFGLKRDRRGTGGLDTGAKGVSYSISCCSSCLLGFITNHSCRWVLWVVFNKVRDVWLNVTVDELGKFSGASIFAI
jgi:hypothetical protein